MTPSKPASAERQKPLLLVDVDGVISLFGFPKHTLPDGSFHWIDGIPHFLSATAGQHLQALAEVFELVWATGWEEKANEYLPRLLGLPEPLPYLRFERGAGGIRSSNAHWKLDAIDAYAQLAPLAWLDDAFNDACHEWARTRQAPTLLVPTEPQQGLTESELEQLLAWATAPR
jgi:hypothetical protein